VTATGPRVGRARKERSPDDIEELTQALERHSWTALLEDRGDAELIERVEEAETLSRELRKVLG